MAIRRHLCFIPKELYPFQASNYSQENHTHLNKIRESVPWNQQLLTWSLNMPFWLKGIFFRKEKRRHFVFLQWIMVFFEWGNSLHILAWNNEWDKGEVEYLMFCLLVGLSRDLSVSLGDACWWLQSAWIDLDKVSHSSSRSLSHRNGRSKERRGIEKGHWRSDCRVC